MNVSLLLQAFSNPVVMVLGLIGAYFVLTTKPAQRRWHWLLFALCVYASSLSEFRDQFVEDAPDLAFPLEQIRALGRPLTAVLVLMLLGIALRTKKGWRHKDMTKPLQLLVCIQAVLLLKISLEGSIVFAAASLVLYGAVITMLVRGPGRWLQEDRDFQWCIQAMVLVGGIFIATALYQASIDLAPMTFVHGLFMGTSGNPQHAGTLLATMVPCLFFLLFNPDQKLWQRGAWLTLLAAILYALVLTGSRTAVLSVVVATAVFFGQRLQRLQTLVLVGLVGAAFVFATTDASFAVSAFDTVIPGKLASLENTRAQVWQAQWNSFLTYPLFGSPLSGARLGYGENSWLAIAASTGIIGLVPAFFFGYQSFRFMAKLRRLGSHNTRYRLHCDTITAGISALLVGSVAEAYLLAILAFPLFALCIYLLLGQYLIEADRYERYSQRLDAARPMSFTAKPES